MGVLILRPDELQGLVSMREAIDVIEQGYREAAEFPVINAPRRRVHAPSGVRVSNFPGGVHGLGVIGAQTRAELVHQHSPRGGAFGEKSREVAFEPRHRKSGAPGAAGSSRVGDRSMGRGEAPPPGQPRRRRP